ncbi:uncharacterized protein K452DRAFT_293563 [Aplosporella prunicola CBS 121167]|uniref:Uncharacterized protein n=1 Tax=Aplosporella prunicola CBS 121167 TaxID=1176127 RepID=A0A6A6BUQ6_9PEZI|nr:uncharacterized protein K452DRAFT_293563 [Aplosporella prunicola CBS 121167]KAF2147083.1 hypothetical protein K452DRAFT_293563 [Aplosporella prunicola CBS 121167]
MSRYRKSAQAYEQLSGNNDSFDNEQRSRRPSWLHRKTSPGVEWHDKWTKDRWKHGRVLLVDYVSREHTPDGRRKIVAQEFHDVEGLRKFYSNKDFATQSAMRVIHVQNASWATAFLLKKFNITSQDDLIGTAFARWIRFERPQQRAGKPVLNGKTFPQRRDPWRKVVRAGFGLDYLRHYDARMYGRGQDETNVKMMELNKYDMSDNPVYGYDVFVQRMSVYVQKKDPLAFSPEDAEVDNPYKEAAEAEKLGHQNGQQPNGYNDNDEHHSGKDHYVPNLPTLDNGNTIIIFEHSHSGGVTDTLIGAREEIESRWRRLMFYLKREDILTDERLSLECMDLILKDIFKALVFSWEKYLRACETHVSILEDKIYDNPADESRAPELWTNSSLWLKVEKLLYVHLDIAKELRLLIKEIMEDDEREEWLVGAPEEFEKLANAIQEDLVKPTSNLSDMMYKSVEIRDSRQSLQLGTSMWRLSWITFIFLPLTFIVGFFGMNVDTFAGEGENLPSIKWYFISAVPLMVFVFLFWYFFKHGISARLPGRGYDNNAPMQRGVYEHLFHEWNEEYSSLWSRTGPRATAADKGIRPGLINRLKWKLIAHWFKPEKTIRVRGYDPHEDLSFWGQVKRNLARRWLSEIALSKDERAARVSGSISGSGRAGGSAGTDGTHHHHHRSSPGAYDARPDDVDLEAGLGLGPGRESRHSEASVRESAIAELLSQATPVALADADPAAARRFVQMRREHSGGSGRSSSPGRGSPSLGSEVMVEEKDEDAAAAAGNGASGGGGGGADSGAEGARLVRRESVREQAQAREVVRAAREALGLGVGLGLETGRLSVPGGERSLPGGGRSAE